MCDSLRDRHSKGKQIARDAQKRHEALCTENASDSGQELRAHSYKRIYLVLQYMRLCVRRISQERPSGIFANTLPALCAKQVPLFQWAIKRLALPEISLASLNQVSKKLALSAGLPLNVQSHGSSPQY